MKKKRITVYGVIELTEGVDEEYADTIFSGNNGSEYLLNHDDYADDIYEWVGANVKLVGWKYKDDGRVFIEVTDIAENASTDWDDDGADDMDGLMYLDEDELDQLSYLEKD